MSHEKIQAEGWIESYVRRRLPPEESAAFEDHYFECDECFGKVEEMERFVSGLRDAGKRGLFDTQPARARWLMPAFIGAMAAAVVLGAGLAYTTLLRLPEREAQLQTALANSAGSQARLEELNRGPQTNVPVVILTANRSAGDAPDRLTIDPHARIALIWIDVPPQPAGAKFRIRISGNAFDKTIPGLERNENGALAAAVPVNDLAAGTYRVQLYPEKTSGQIMAEYRMTVARQ